MKKCTYRIPFLLDKQPKGTNNLSAEQATTTKFDNKTKFLHKIKLKITRRFRPVYEIEYQENQWVQLEHATNKYIEELYQRGFTRMVIRRDKQLDIIMPKPAISTISISHKNSNDLLEKGKAFTIRRKALLQFKNRDSEKWSISSSAVFDEEPTIINPLSYTEPPFLFNG